MMPSKVVRSEFGLVLVNKAGMERSAMTVDRHGGVLPSFRLLLAFA